MPVPLPPAPTGPTPLPPSPEDPPTTIDICNAVMYNRDIRLSRAAGVATEDDVGQGAIYEAALVAQRAVAPAWFEPALKQALDAQFKARLAPMTRLTTKTHNRLVCDGHIIPFQIVPFLDGSLPTDHNLPALVNFKAVDALTGVQCNAYLTGYNIPVPHAIAERKGLIRVEIGCTVHDDYEDSEDQ